MKSVWAAAVPHCLLPLRIASILYDSYMQVCILANIDRHPPSLLFACIFVKHRPSARSRTLHAFSADLSPFSAGNWK